MLLRRILFIFDKESVNAERETSLGDSCVYNYRGRRMEFSVSQSFFPLRSSLSPPSLIICWYSGLFIVTEVFFIWFADYVQPTFWSTEALNIQYLNSLKPFYHIMPCYAGWSECCFPLLIIPCNCHLWGVCFRRKQHRHCELSSCWVNCGSSNAKDHVKEIIPTILKSVVYGALP